VKDHTDTIAAIATAIGVGALSIVRVSGKDAIGIVDKVFRGKSSLKSTAGFTAHLGLVVDREGETIDEVVVTVYKAPRSFTGEDSVEVSCHGGVLVTRRVLEAILSAGARLAEPGEFTKRAFLNGRLDLAQAEAVADLIHSQSELSRRSSLEQLQGKLSRVVNQIRNELIEISSLLELELDFAEEEIELADKVELSEKLRAALVKLKELIDSFEVGKIYREGVKVVISGKPNVGKSSLLNALLNENRAIVTEIPGTTRDTIEENITIDGILFRLVDTAGLRATTDVVEKEGVRRTQGQLAGSDLVLFVMDASQPIDNLDIQALEAVKRELGTDDARLVLVMNKVDLVGNAMQDHVLTIDLPAETRKVRVSALTHAGLDSLRRIMIDSVLANGIALTERSTTVTNARHKEALVRAHRQLGLALESMESGKSGEFVALDLRAALDCLGEIVGAVTTEEILNNIFSRFCIGK